MIETEIDIPTNDGQMNTFVSHPGQGGPFPAVFMYMPASGIREELRDMARRLAGNGYVVLLPNLYYRLVRHVDIDANRLFDEDYEPVRAFMAALNAAYTNQRAVDDTGAMIRWADAQSWVATTPIGVVGYCMGGRLAFSAIGAHPERIAACMSMYGAGLHTDRPDSPHLRAAQVAGELYFGVAENDAYVPMAMVDRLREHLAPTRVQHRIEIYPGTEHGFCFPKRYCYSREADQRHWDVMLDLFDRRLRQAGSMVRT